MEKPLERIQSRMAKACYYDSKHDIDEDRKY